MISAPFLRVEQGAEDPVIRVQLLSTRIPVIRVVAAQARDPYPLLCPISYHPVTSLLVMAAKNLMKEIFFIGFFKSYYKRNLIADKT
jgi:hypothetical protein